MINRARDRHFQAAVLQKLYPPQPLYDDENQLPYRDNQVEQDQIIEVSETVRNVPSEDQTDSHASDSPSNSDEKNGQHLTRAQRKRIRKRKMKEAASRSKKFVGPLLPDNHIQENFTSETSKWLDAECSGSKSETENTIIDAVRSTDPPVGIDSGSSTCHGKLKQRRRAKKLKQENAKSAQRENLSKVFMAESCETGYILKHL
ncbi:uncharacterized protein LOC131062772 isoform X2 [Cryptomeria japonica]|uniref:uncharacterized protein LOC131062772 isoform X2 n=1 Tax=Cryptomeria japonica TaxID=3369 RepID=UPI0025AC60F9|nr:uncharacterized protein LOC131062772 isoform X2 [Cryptomeria japonica]